MSLAGTRGWRVFGSGPLVTLVPLWALISRSAETTTGSPGSSGPREAAAPAFPIADGGREALIRWQSEVWRYRTEVVQGCFEGHQGAKLLVRYEDLRARPAVWLSRICAALGIEADEATVQAVAGKHAFENVPDAKRGERQEIRAAKPGGWRVNLSEAEHKAMDRIMGPKLAELGYLPELEPPSQVRTRA